MTSVEAGLTRTSLAERLDFRELGREWEDFGVEDFGVAREDGGGGGGGGGREYSADGLDMIEAISVAFAGTCGALVLGRALGGCCFLRRERARARGS